MSIPCAPTLPVLAAVLGLVAGCARGPEVPSQPVAPGLAPGEAIVQGAVNQQLAYGPDDFFSAGTADLKLYGFQAPAPGARPLDGNRWAVPAGTVRFKAFVGTPGTEEAPRFPVTIRFTARPNTAYYLSLDEARNYRLTNIATNRIVTTVFNPAPWNAPESLSPD